MADAKPPHIKDLARQTLRDDDDDGDSVVRGGEGVRPLTPHTPIHSKDGSGDRQSRAPTMRILRGSVPEDAEANDDKRKDAHARIKEAMASMVDPSSSGSESATAPLTPKDQSFAEGDEGATEVNPIVLPKSIPGPVTPSKGHKAARPRRRSQHASLQGPASPAAPEEADDANAPATIRVPVMTPSRLKELAELDDEAAWAALNADTPHSRQAKETSRVDVSDFALDAPIEDATKVAVAAKPSTDTEIGERATETHSGATHSGATQASSGATNEADEQEDEWDEATVAEDVGGGDGDSIGRGMINAEVRAGLPPSHRIATMAPIATLSADGTAVPDDEVVVAPPSHKRPERKTLPPPPVATGSLPAPKSSDASRPQGDAGTQVQGTIDLDPTDAAASIAALQQAPGTQRLGTPQAGESVRGPLPPPTPHTFHDDDDDAEEEEGDKAAPENSVETSGDEMRESALVAIAKAQAEIDSDDEIEVPKKIGVYSIDGLLGEGGMAEVFRARHPSQGNVVLKRMRPSLLTEKRYVEMFVREAKVATSLSHANIVSTLDFGVANGAHYLVMEELVGMSLRDLADRVWESGRSLPLEVVLRCCADAARGLHHAHITASLVHRDVSPDNVFATCAGITKMLDFGIAKQPDSARLTRTGEIKGKVPFMSPEHILGDTPVNGRSDVWSLGVTLYWLLCGVRPFEGTTDVMTLQHVVEKPHASVLQRNAVLPEAVAVVVDRALQKRAEDRYSSCLAFAEALEAAAIALVPVDVGADDDDATSRKLNAQVAKTILDAQDLPLPSRPARAPFPACVSVFSPPPVDATVVADMQLQTEAQEESAIVAPPKRSSPLWLVAGLMVGATGALAIAALVVIKFLLPGFFGGEG